ncbi:hypothetical protein QM480_04500 [Flectobacillus sp. DC10W]|uniref:Uncharacterized protein n=1 Tax=Flectobacillus longus TaxID=2984207 RepID=A0ABT6YJ01_9BACT|nr:hypothetical protein [Flectobacillus longus]MDI9863569.1 hypothetical protein [Flectobacillus longus]
MPLPETPWQCGDFQQFNPNSFAQLLQSLLVADACLHAAISIEV